MSIPVVLTVGPIVAGVSNYFVTSRTPTSGQSLPLAHTTVATPRRILATVGSEASGRTIRLTGTNADGNPIRETLAIPATSAGTYQSTQDFASLSEALTGGGAWSAAMTLGTSGVASSPWKLVNAQHQSLEAISWFGEVTGTVVWGIEYGYANPNNNQNQMGGALGNYPTPVTPLDLPQLTGKTGNADASVDNPFQCWRVKLNSGTGSVTVTAIEGGFTESGG